MDYFVTMINECMNCLKLFVILKTELLHTAIKYFHKELILDVDMRHEDMNVFEKFKGRQSCILCTFMKTLCPPSCHHNGFVATHALGHKMHVCIMLIPMNQKVINKPSEEDNVSGLK